MNLLLGEASELVFWYLAELGGGGKEGGGGGGSLVSTSASPTHFSVVEEKYSILQGLTLITGGPVVYIVVLLN